VCLKACLQHKSTQLHDAFIGHERQRHDCMHFALIGCSEIIIIIIQMMHGSEWTLKYDEPEVENVARWRSPNATFSTEGHHISMSHERPCFMFCRMANH